jgi:two-component system, OmpR family, phosphate regulon sensor histidine kinase PhoR
MNIPAILLGCSTGIFAGLAWHFWRLSRRSRNAVTDRQRNAVLESVLEGLGDACLLIDEAQHIVFANHETRDLFHTASPPAGQPLSNLIADDRIPGFISRIAGSGVKWGEEHFRVQLIRDGALDERHLVVAAAPVHLFGEQSPAHMRVVIRDETDRHETEQIRKDFVANASHELRTPLSIINGYLENMLDGIIDDPAVMRKSLITMQKHGERIARIVEDMLTLSKFESAGEKNQPGIRDASFSCRECVQDVVERLAPLIEAKQARMDLRFPAAPLDQIYGDRFYWDQIFFNLIENALKENQPGSLVIGVHFTRQEDAALITVRDNGVGIPRADLPFVFKRFYRVAKHHSQKIKGTGLGLSIVRRAVEAHGGTIFVDSTPGLETIFTIKLPDLVAVVVA